MQKLLIATHNEAKVHEFREFLSDLPLELVSLSDLKIAEDVEEDGVTYEANSQKKALFYAKLSGLPSLSDDGGLEIAALHGEPGVQSKRWLGYVASEEELIAHMAKVAKDLPDNNRTAHFRLVLTFAMPSGEKWSVNGSVQGIIAQKPMMNIVKGFPFRSYFYLPEIQKYYHENTLSHAEMKQYNHRLQAAMKLKPIIKTQLHIQ